MNTRSETWVIARFAFAAAAVWTMVDQYLKGWVRPLLNRDVLLLGFLVLGAIGVNISVLRRWVRQRQARVALKK